MTAEDRQAVRTLVCLPCNEEQCTVQVGSEWFASLRIEDISEAGAGIALPLPLDPGLAVRVRFRGDADMFAVGGHVVWSRPEPAEASPMHNSGFRVGIRFAPADQGTARRLTAHLRQYCPFEELA